MISGFFRQQSGTLCFISGYGILRLSQAEKESFYDMWHPFDPDRNLRLHIAEDFLNLYARDEWVEGRTPHDAIPV